MIMDKLCLFSDAQAIVNTGVCTDKMDLSLAAHDFGAGEELWLVVSVATVYARAAGDFTITPVLVTDDDSALGSPTTLLTGPATAKAALTAGAVIWKVRLPSAAYERFLGVSFTFSAAADSGALDAFLVKTPDIQKHYTSGFSIS